MVALSWADNRKAAVHMQVATIGLDIAKNVFQVHGIDAGGRAVLRRKARRNRLLALFTDLEPCLVGMEACATAHHWARALGTPGHEVRLMPPAYVKAYVKRNKNDAADAEAICEAVTRRGQLHCKRCCRGDAQYHDIHRSAPLLSHQNPTAILADRAERGGPSYNHVIAANGIPCPQ